MNSLLPRRSSGSILGIVLAGFRKVRILLVPVFLAPVFLGVFALIALIVLMASERQTARAASADCARARGPDERLICTTPALNAADVAVAQAYAALLEAVGGDETARSLVRTEQRGWIVRRNRACGLVAGSEPSADERAAAIACLTAALNRRSRLLIAAQVNLPLGVRIRTVVSDESDPRRNLSLHVEYPEITDPTLPGAGFFNQAVRHLVADEIRIFRADAAELPPEFEPSLTLTSDLYFAAAGVLSVQFRAEGVLGNGFLYAAALTIDLPRTRVLTPGDVFTGTGWLITARTACRKSAGADPDIAETCVGPELEDPRTWRFEAGRAVLTLLFPGKELREIPLSYRNLASSLRPGGPIQEGNSGGSVPRTP